MDNSWRMELWVSTCPSFRTTSTEVDPKCRELSGPFLSKPMVKHSQILRQHSDSARQASKCILSQPYNPEYWLQRAGHLLNLGFPELAAGDARKASWLCADGHRDDILSLGGKVELQPGSFVGLQSGERADQAEQYSLQKQLFLILSAEESLIGSLHMLDDLWEALKICKEGKAFFPGVQFYQVGFKAIKKQWFSKQTLMREYGLPKAEINNRLVRGEAESRPYPFMSIEYLRRNEGLVTRIQQDFNNCTFGRCTVSASTIQGATKSEILGVIANSDIEAGTRLYEECTLLVASSDNPLSIEKSRTYNVCEFCCDTIQSQQKEIVRCENCSATYCHVICQVSALKTYHKVLCGKDFGWLYDVDRNYKPTGGKPVAKDKAVEGALWLRILALCVQEGCHPLEHHLIARLTSQYERNMAIDWSLSGNIDRVQEILLQLGGDIYSDLRYDTWVMQTIWGRLTTNQLEDVGFEGRLVRIVGRLWCFHNHSCEPNAAFGRMLTAAGNDRRPSVSIACAIRPIKKGEEVFISYVNITDQSRSSRQHFLRKWLPEGCGCTKCERGEQVMARRLSQKR